MRIWLSMFAVVAALAVAQARAETRIALVIGNANYAHAPRLPNPPNDTAAVAAALRQAGFSVVTIRQDLTEDQFKVALLEFSRAAHNADVALVHYSGHGIEVGGTNYLVPVDATLTTDSDVDFEAVPLDLVLHAVEGARRLRLVLLDACRSNPFAATMARTNATRAIGRGLARVEPSSDTLVVYAAKAGSTASDGSGTVSPFSAAFARDVVQPGIEISKLFRLVHDQVMASTGSTQEPFVYGSLSAADFYFVAPSGAAAAPVTAVPVLAAPDARTVELAYWDSIKGSSDAADFRSYLAQYPSGMFASLAGNRIASLQKPAAPAPATPVAGGPTLEMAFWDSVKASSDPADFKSYLARYPKGTFAALARNRIASLAKPQTPLTPSQPTPNAQVASLPQAPAVTPPTYTTEAWTIEYQFRLHAVHDDERASDDTSYVKEQFRAFGSESSTTDDKSRTHIQTAAFLAAFGSRDPADNFISYFHPDLTTMPGFGKAGRLTPVPRVATGRIENYLGEACAEYAFNGVSGCYTQDGILLHQKIVLDDGSYTEKIPLSLKREAGPESEWTPPPGLPVRAPQ